MAKRLKMSQVLKCYLRDPNPVFFHSIVFPELGSNSPFLTTEELSSSTRNSYQGKNNTCIFTSPNAAPFVVFNISASGNSNPSPTVCLSSFYHTLQSMYHQNLFLQIIHRVWPLLTQKLLKSWFQLHYLFA